MTLLGRANDSVDLVKAALDAKIALATAEDKEKLADAKLALSDLKTLISEMKEEINDLKESIKRKEEYELYDGVYWSVSDSDKNQPYCSVCFTIEKVVPLQKNFAGKDKRQSLWSCPSGDCRAVFNPWEYNEPSENYENNIFYQ